jgi:hypothetical protein
LTCTEGHPLHRLLPLAAQNIPVQLYRAARVDGAGTLARFRHVTLPGLRVPMLIAIVLQSIWALKVFDLIYVLTKGGPFDATSPFPTTRTFTRRGAGRHRQSPLIMSPGHRLRAVRPSMPPRASVRCTPGRDPEVAHERRAPPWASAGAGQTALALGPIQGRHHQPVSDFGADGRH